MVAARASAGPPSPLDPPLCPPPPLRGWTGCGSRRGWGGPSTAGAIVGRVCVCPLSREPAVLQEGAWDVNLAAGSILGFVFPLLPSIGGKAAFPLQSSCLAGGKPGGHPPPPTPPRPETPPASWGLPLYPPPPGYGRGSGRRRGRGCLPMPAVIPDSGIAGEGRGGDTLIPPRRRTW